MPAAPEHGRILGRPRGSRPGFTLLEAALSTVIIGVGIVAMVDAQSAFITANLWSSHAASGTYLANEIREMTRGLDKHDPVTGLFNTISGGSPVLNGWGPEANETTLVDFDDLDDFDGLVLSWLGTAGHADGDLPGPVDAFGNVIDEIPLEDLEPTIDPETGDEIPPPPPGPMQGWSQAVTVEKLDPYDSGVVVADGAFVARTSGDPGRRVDQYPLRITVETRFQPPFQATGETIARVSWIVP